MAFTSIYLLDIFKYEEFGEERMKDEEWLKWYLQRKRNQGDLDHLVKEYENWMSDSNNNCLI